MARGDRPSKPVHERVLEKVTQEGDCWISGHKPTNDGYALVRVGSRKDGTRKLVLAHRVMFEWANGPIPEDKEVDHICRVRNCVRPAHLRLLTHQENTARMVITSEDRAARSERMSRYNASLR